MSINIDDIAGPEGDSYKFEAIGDTAKGVIVHAEEMVRESQYSGKDERVLRITLEQDDGSNAIIWPVTNTDVNGDGYATRMAKAVAAAVRAANATSLENGGTLAVQFSGEKPTDKGNPAKLFTAEYKPPAATGPVEADAADGAVSGLI